MKLLEVPEDILVCIVRQLDYWSIVACEMSSRSFHNLVQRDARLVYTKESLRCGQTPLLLEPAHELLDSLRKYEKGWSNLSSAFETLNPIKVYLPVGYRLPEESRLSVSITDRYIMWNGLFSGTPSVSRYDINSGTLEAPWQTHRSREDDVFTVKPDQDLFVWILDLRDSYRFSCRSLSTGESHPEAGLDTQTVYKEHWECLERNPRLSGDYLLFTALEVLGGDFDPVLYILYWKKTNRSPIMQRIIGCETATFLSNDTVFYNIGPLFTLAKLSIETDVPSADKLDSEEVEFKLQVHTIAQMSLYDSVPSMSHTCSIEVMPIPPTVEHWHGKQAGISASMQGLVFVLLCAKSNLPPWVLAIDTTALLTNPNLRALAASHRVSERRDSLSWSQWSSVVPTAVFGPLPPESKNARAYTLGSNRLVVNTAPVQTYEFLPPHLDGSGNPKKSANAEKNDTNTQNHLRKRLHDLPNFCNPEALYFGPHHAVLWNPDLDEPHVSFSIFEVHGRREDRHLECGMVLDPNSTKRTI